MGRFIRPSSRNTPRPSQHGGLGPEHRKPGASASPGSRIPGAPGTRRTILPAPCDQERSDFVAVQASGVGFVVDPRPAKMGGRGVIEQVFLDRALVQTRDGGQPRVTVARARPAASRSRANSSMSARRAASRARRRRRHHAANWRRSSAYARGSGLSTRPGTRLTPASRRGRTSARALPQFPCLPAPTVTPGLQLADARPAEHRGSRRTPGLPVVGPWARRRVICGFAARAGDNWRATTAY
jgi:hypothetical protein